MFDVQIVSLEAGLSVRESAVFVDSIADDASGPMVLRLTLDTGRTVISVQDTLSGKCVLIAPGSP